LRNSFDGPWQPGHLDFVDIQVLALGEGLGLVLEQLVVPGHVLVRHQGIAEVLGEVVLVGDQHRGDRRVVLVGQAGNRLTWVRYCSAKRFIACWMVTLT
jgi:hypothetical protein